MDLDRATFAMSIIDKCACMKEDEQTNLYL